MKIKLSDKEYEKLKHDPFIDMSVYFLSKMEKDPTRRKQKVKKLELHNKVVFKGFQNTLHWYKKSKIFVISSRFEGTPNVLLEAMAMGLPSIITSSCPGAMYYVKHGISGLIVPPENTLALAKSIRMIVNNKNLQKKIIQGGFKSLTNLANHRKVFKQWDQCIFN